MTSPSEDNARPKRTLRQILVPAPLKRAFRKNFLPAEWAQIGSFAQWIMVFVTVYGLFQVYQLTRAAQSIATINLEQVFFNRSLNLLETYYYKLYEPHALTAGRCIAYLIDIPDPIFADYINKKPDKSPLFKEDIVDIGEIIARIDAWRDLRDEERSEIKKELYLDYDICLDLDEDESFSAVFREGKTQALSDRADNIRRNLPQRYRSFGLLYVPYLDIRDHALIMWVNDVADMSKISNLFGRRDKLEYELRERETMFIEGIFKYNFCHPKNRMAQFLKKIKRVDRVYYETVIIKEEFPRFGQFLEERCPDVKAAG